MAAVLQRAKDLLHPLFISRVLYGLVFVLLFLRCLLTLDPDFGWHLTSGQYILIHGIPASDIYTYTAGDFPWIHHEWLADVINATIFTIGGYPLLAFVFAALWTMAIYLMAGKQNWRGAVIVLITAVAAAQFIAIRDTAWTALFLALTHRAFAHYRGYLPLLFVLWANLHGGFMVGLAYLGWRIVYERRWRDAWVIVVAAAATLVNPYGAALYREIFATLLDPTLHTTIDEWRHWGIGLTTAIVPLLWLGPVIHSLYKKRWRGIVQFDTLLLAASFMSLRHFVLFCLFSLPRTTQFYTQAPLCVRQFVAGSTRKKVIRLSLLYGSVLTGILLVVAAGIAALGAPLAFTPDPIKAVRSLQQTACKGNIFNHYDIGGYLIWQYPAQKVYIDGRMPSWRHKGVDYMANYTRVLNDELFQKQQFATYQIACAVLPIKSELAQSLQRQGWKSEPDTASGWVLLRK